MACSSLYEGVRGIVTLKKEDMGGMADIIFTVTRCEIPLLEDTGAWVWQHKQNA